MMHFYPFHIGDYLKSTSHLTPLEDIAYRRLLDLYYDTEKKLINDPKELARLIRMREYQADVDQVLDEFFLSSESGYHQKRVSDEIKDFVLRHESAKNNGEKGGRPKKSRSKTSDRFSDFWFCYPKKVAKKPCLNKWRNLNLDAKADIIIADVKNRIENHRPWIDGYSPNPLTYINGERWEDAIEFPVTKKTEEESLNRKNIENAKEAVYGEMRHVDDIDDILGKPLPEGS